MWISPEWCIRDKVQVTVWGSSVWVCTFSLLPLWENSPYRQRTACWPSCCNNRAMGSFMRWRWALWVMLMVDRKKKCVRSCQDLESLCSVAFLEDFYCLYFISSIQIHNMRLMWGQKKTETDWIHKNLGILSKMIGEIYLQSYTTVKHLGACVKIMWICFQK